ncbi:MAG TPA: hypothetical protein VFR31_11950 [Thermoanaerobaculia bacterium]|nr:hypothetical protein [Thermoanaerobaculia bacterium]
MDIEEEAQNELFEVVAQLRGIRFRLLGIGSLFPPEADCKEIIECVLADAVAPAIRDLTRAAELLADRDERGMTRLTLPPPFATLSP